MLKILGKIIKWVVGLILGIVIIVAGIWGYFYYSKDINLIKVYDYVSTLSEDVNVNSIVTNAYSAEDLTSAKSKVDNVSIFDASISLTDKEIGAYINDKLKSNESVNLTVGGENVNLKDLNFEVGQVMFSNIPQTAPERGAIATFNVVVKLDIAKLIEDNLSKFPLSLIKGSIPKNIYVSATVDILNYDSALGDAQYSVKYNNLTINNLNTKDTIETIDLIGKITKMDSAQKLCETICTPFVDALIGTEQNSGMAYELMQKGATGYAFTEDANGRYFTVYKQAVL